MDNDLIQITNRFPAILTLKKRNLDLTTCFNILNTERVAIQKKLLIHGALLFRGWPIASAKEFSQFIETLRLGKFVNYIGGDSPRDKVEKHVYTSTEAPPRFHIPLHQELSFIKHFPRQIYFYCEMAPVVRGETIIGDARQMYKTIDSALLKKFQSKQLMYISRYFFQSQLMTWVNRFQRSHKSWVEVFETKDKQIVEQLCLQNEFDWQWLANDWLEIRQTRPAITTHPITKETVWFNQAHLYDFNRKLLGLTKYWGAKLFYFKKSTRLHEIYYADGEPIQRKEIYYLLDFYKKNTVSFPWQARDVLVLDNILAMHGRAPFSGSRRILTAMTA